MEAAAVLERETLTPMRTSPTWPMRTSLVLALAGFLFFAQLGSRALWSEEVRWAQIPREMQTSGDYLSPTINGKSYYDKPLGSYWLVLIASWFTGEVNETSARLPSALCGLISVFLSMLIARRLFDDAAALWTGIILATSFSFVFFARTAAADMENVTGILAVLWLFLRNEDRPAGLWTLGLWLLMALTSLTKGLLGFAVPIVVIGVYCTFTSPQRQQGPAATIVFARNRWFFNRMTLAAIPLAALVYLGPFLLSSLITGSSEGLAMVYRENVRRFFDPVNHRGPIYLYVGVIFVLMAPWSLLLPAALWPTAMDGRGRAFALAYFWGTFAFFTLSASRRSYYLLPILPAGAMLLARLLTRPEPLARWPRILLRTGFFVLAAAILLSGLALAPLQKYLPTPWNTLPALPCPAAFAAMWIGCVGAVASQFFSFPGSAWERYTARLCLAGPRQLRGASAGRACGVVRSQAEPGNEGRRRIARASCVIAAATMGYLYVFALPAVEIHRTQKPFADAVNAEIGASANLALYRTREIVYYLDAPKPLPEIHDAAELHAASAEKRVVYLIVRRRDWDGLNLTGNIRVAELIQPWDGPAQIETKLLLVEVDTDQSVVSK